MTVIRERRNRSATFYEVMNKGDIARVTCLHSIIGKMF